MAKAGARPATPPKSRGMWPHQRQITANMEALQNTYEEFR